MMKNLLTSMREQLRYTPFRRVLVQYRHRGFDPGDVFLAAFPKSGSTWVRAMLTSLILERNDNWEAVKDVSRMVGKHWDAPRRLPHDGRLIKTHEPYRPQYRKAIVVVRDGRDVAVSLYYYNNQSRSIDLETARAEFPHYLRRFLSGRASPNGSWHDHVRSWQLAAQDSGHELLFVRYEDCKQNAVAELQRICTFLQIPADAAHLVSAVNNNDIGAMRDREKRSRPETINGKAKMAFVRKGVVGDWMNYFTAELEQQFAAVAGDVLSACGYEIRRSSECGHTPPLASR